jgi:hypothetical protein
MRPTEVESQVRSAGRLFLMAVLALVLAAVAVVTLAHPHHGPAVAPCPARPSGCSAPGHPPMTP